MFDQIDPKAKESEQSEFSCCNALLNEVLQDKMQAINVSDEAARTRKLETGWVGDSPEARDKRVNDTVQAVKDLAANGDKWYVIRSRLVAEYESGRDAATADRNLRSMIARVNRELGAAGEIKVEHLGGQLARLIAEGERMKDPDSVLSFRVKHGGGTMGPIGVCFKVRR